MSIRKISDLEGQSFEKIYADQDLSSRLLNSLVEISYPEKIQTELGDKTAYAYKSKYCKYFDLKDNFLHSVFYGDTEDGSETSVTFYADTFFRRSLNGLCSMYLSGNLYLNLDVPADEIANGKRDPRSSGEIGHELKVKSAENTLYASYTDNNLYSNENNNIVARASNVISARDNCIQAGRSTLMKSGNGDQIASFSSSLIQANVPVKLLDNAYVQDDMTVKNCMNSKSVNCETVKCETVNCSKVLTNGLNCQAKDEESSVGEVFLADSPDYPIGTLVKFGGNYEITIAKNGDVPNAVVVGNPIISIEPKTESSGIKLPVALVGKAKIRVKGAIAKFDKIKISDKEGVGIKSTAASNNIAIALEASTSSEETLIMCVTRMQF